MLEIGIIVCLAGALFLALKNYSRTGEDTIIDIPEGLKNEDGKKQAYFKFSFLRKPKDKDIMKEIDKNKAEIIPPSEINKAILSFKEDDPELAKCLYEADLAFMRNDLRGAEDLAIEAISKDKKCASAYLIVGKVAKERGSFDEAKESYLVALKCDPNIAEAYFGLGMIDSRNENYSVAIENLQKAVNIERGHADWYAELGKAYMQIRQYVKACKALKKAASLDIDNKEYRLLAAEAEEKMRNISRAYRMR